MYLVDVEGKLFGARKQVLFLGYGPVEGAAPPGGIALCCLLRHAAITHRRVLGELPAVGLVLLLLLHVLERVEHANGDHADEEAHNHPARDDDVDGGEDEGQAWLGDVLVAAEALELAHLGVDARGVRVLGPGAVGVGVVVAVVGVLQEGVAPEGARVYRVGEASGGLGDIQCRIV